MGWAAMADKQNKHLAKFEATQLLDGEQVTTWARAFREGTNFEGVVVLTGKRLCFFRAGTLSDKFEPFPLSKISSVEAKKGLLLFKMQVHTSGDDIELTLVDGAANGATFVREVQQALHTDAAVAAPNVAQGADDPLSALEKLGKLRDAGVVTPAEFEAKKAELLARL